jgi:hypothetical protein
MADKQKRCKEIGVEGDEEYANLTWEGEIPTPRRDHNRQKEGQMAKSKQHGWFLLVEIVRDYFSILPGKEDKSAREKCGNGEKSAFPATWFNPQINQSGKNAQCACDSRQDIA